jgi:hypothetical protein
MQGMKIMNLKNKMLSKRKLTASIAAAAVALSIGAYAIVDANGSNGAAASAAGTTNAAKVIPFQAGQPGASKTVGQIPASFSAGTGTIVTGTA